MAPLPRLPSEILLLILNYGVKGCWTIPGLFQARLVNTTFADEILTLLLQTERLGKECFYRQGDDPSGPSSSSWTTFPERLKRLYLRAKIDQNDSRPCTLSQLVHKYVDTRPSPDRDTQIQKLVNALARAGENWSSQITELQITLAQDAIARNDPVTLQNVLGDGSDAGEIPLKSGHLHDTPPLYLAARVGTREIMETLLKYGTWMGCNFERLAMKIAIQCRNHAVLDVWLDPQWLSHNPLICPGPTFRAAFIECARVGDLEMVERLSGRCGGYSTDPAEIHFEAFLEAIRSGQVAVAEWILRLGWFEVENSTVRFSIPKSALFIALQDCHPPARVPMVRMLLSYRADPNELCPSVKGTPLQAAIELNNPELINLLLDHGADPSASTPGNMRLRAPLLYATRKGDVKLVRQFFEHGANPLIVFRGKTLLDEAKAGRILKEVTEILVEFEWAERFDKWMKSGKISE